MINSMVETNREAIDETNIPIKVKSRFVNYLFYNTDLEEASFCKTTVCFLLLFLLFLALSIFLFAEVSTVVVESVMYYEEGSSACSSVTDPVTNITTNGCSASIEVDDHMVAPIYVMYQVGILLIIKTTSTRTSAPTFSPKTATSSPGTKYRKLRPSPVTPSFPTQKWPRPTAGTGLHSTQGQSPVPAEPSVPLSSPSGFLLQRHLHSQGRLWNHHSH